MSNLITEILLRFIKPAAAALLGLVAFLVATALGEPASISLALVSFLCGAAFVLLAQEGVI